MSVSSTRWPVKVMRDRSFAVGQRVDRGVTLPLLHDLEEEEDEDAAAAADAAFFGHTVATTDAGSSADSSEHAACRAAAAAGHGVVFVDVDVDVGSVFEVDCALRTCSNSFKH